MVTGRAFRRSQVLKAKKKAVWVMKNSWGYRDKDVTPAGVGIVAGTHGKPCSCTLCGNPRRHFGELTIQERRQCNDG